MPDTEEKGSKEKPKKTDVEVLAEKRKEEEAKEVEIKQGVKDYFSSIGIDPEISKNSFGVKEAIETFAKAEDALKTMKDNKYLVSNILDRAWQIFKLLT